jgi:hypothetical protein
MSRRWEKVGECAVDAALIWIGDPSYCVTPDGDDHPAQTWKEFCDQIEDMEAAKQFNFARGHPGLGVCVRSGYGDGVYPVYVRRGSTGRVIEAKIVFESPSGAQAVSYRASQRRRRKKPRRRRRR